MLALSAYVAMQSRGDPIAPPDDQRLKPFIEKGHALFTQRMGQLNLSCSQCHNDNWGKNIAGNIMPQAHPTGYPIYRLEWQGMGSLQRRLRNCMIGVRAEPYAYGAPEYVEMELYLMQRARGMTIETPAVRP
jgi:sulfur-oxidizing protein SoxA